jgi:hypothetical protein
MKPLLKRLLLAIVLTVPALCEAHERYPYPCCGGIDCGPIVGMVMLPNGNKLITIHTSTGANITAEFPGYVVSQPPIDERDHACIIPSPYGNMPTCLFLNGGV